MERKYTRYLTWSQLLYVITNKNTIWIHRKINHITWLSLILIQVHNRYFHSSKSKKSWLIKVFVVLFWSCQKILTSSNIGSFVHSFIPSKRKKFSYGKFRRYKRWSILFDRCDQNYSCSVFQRVNEYY